ncbi:MAG TPA: diacylglycerol kinase [Bacillota bacterium]|nr:diacylglycerol kinase [Bacillota bacterium]
MVIRKLLDSFNYAVAGIVYAVRTQRNMKIHLAAAFLVLLLGICLRVSSRDLLFLFFAITLVIMAEMINTAIEGLVDLNVKEFHPVAKNVKNIAAGAVLITVLNSVVVAYVVFYPHLEVLSFQIGPEVREAPLAVTLTALLLVVVLIVAGKARSGKGAFVKGGLPSGHTAVAFAGGTVLALLAGNFLTASIALTMALIVAHSRLDSKSHTLFEVIMGAVLGILVPLVVFRLGGW